MGIGKTTTAAILAAKLIFAIPSDVNAAEINANSENGYQMVQQFVDKIKIPYRILVYEDGTPFIDNSGKIKAFVSSGNLELGKEQLEKELSEKLGRPIKLKIKQFKPNK